MVTVPAQAEGVEKASSPASIAEAANAEETNKNEVGLNPTSSEPGTGGGKVKKEKRARVRFGEDEILDGPAASTARPTENDRNHDHSHGHGHDHQHQPQQRGSAPVPRATVRHDRPDLYEF